MSDIQLTDGAIIGLDSEPGHPLLRFLSYVCGYITLARTTITTVYRWWPFPFASARGIRKAVARLLHRILIFAVMAQFILSGMSGITSHLVSHAHTVVRNTQSITLAFCALPMPFKDTICARIGNAPPSPLIPNIDHYSASHPFLINEDVHGPAIDLAIRKAANATSAVLALVRASDITQRHEISDKLKDFLQRAWACEDASGAHVALVKTAVDEMLLENFSVFAKLQADLHTGLLSRLVAFIWVRQAEHTVLKALVTAEDSATTHAHRLFTHGNSAYQSLRLMESIALDISGLLATEIASLKREKEEVISRLSTTFGMHRGTLRILEGRLSDLRCISDLWREARDLLSLGIHAFNGIRSDLAALREHQAGPKTGRLYVPVDQQNRHFQAWVRRLEARRVLTRAQVY